ncbi:hypothetical protein C0995_006227 [Termitomyces sp. Mi166|nr:hypothetical protein C0995_006227 [Termitomyces sp. Mi166\
MSPTLPSKTRAVGGKRGKEAEFVSSLTPSTRKQISGIAAQKGGSNSRDRDDDEEELISSLSFASDGYDELLDDVGKGMCTKNKEDEDTDTSSEQAESVADLSSRFKGTNDTPNLSYSVSADIRKYDDARFLDLTAVCFPNVLIDGEGKQTDMRSTTQPWFRFCLGLMVAKDKMGWLRADATGVEECVFPKNIGRGVIESNRLSLEILLATDQELGQHPSFSLRSVTSGDDDPTAAVGTKRPAADNNDGSKLEETAIANFGKYPSRPHELPMASSAKTIHMTSDTDLMDLGMYKQHFFLFLDERWFGTDKSKALSFWYQDSESDTLGHAAHLFRTALADR